MSSTSLVVPALGGLLIGPLCDLLGTRLWRVQALVDGFALAVVGGLCAVLVLPHAVGEIGIAALALAALGALVPALFHHHGRDRSWSFALFTFALLLHVVLDGAVLSAEDAPLGWAVVAHRLPVGFALVVAVQGSPHPRWVAWALAAAMGGATVLGYLSGPTLLVWLPPAGPTALEALVAGVLLHVVFAPHTGREAPQPGAVSDHHAAQAHTPERHHGCGHNHGAHQDHAHQDHAHQDHACHACGHSHGAHHGHAHHDHASHDHAHHDHASHDHASHEGSDHGDASHGHRHAHDGDESVRSDNRWGAAGALGGLLVMLAGATLLAPQASEEHVPAFLQTLGVLLLESAPALLAGYALAGVIPFVLTPRTARTLARGSRLAQSLRGVAFGLPLPVCSCGVLPLYESLVRRGAPSAAAMAFFVATPELGLDAVLLSVPLLGPSLALSRVVSAFAVALLVALLVGGQHGPAVPTPEAPTRARREPWPSRVRAGLRFGFAEVFDHTMPWVALGLLVAAMAEPMLSHGALAGVPGVLQVPLSALVGVPIYVCASGATPVAALALHKGVTAGAAVAFLIAGPATNVTTFGVLARLHGRRTAVRFGVAVTALAILSGWIVDALGISGAPVLDAHANAETHGSWFSWACVSALALLTIASLLRQGPRGALRQILKPIHTH